MSYRLEPLWGEGFNPSPLSSKDRVVTICLKCHRIIEVSGEVYKYFRGKGGHLCEECEKSEL